MISRSHRAWIGVLAAGVLSIPVLSGAIAAPKKKAPPKKTAPKKADPKAGMTAFKTEGCAGCHKAKDYPMAGEVGPDLTDIAKEHKAADVAAYIKKPKAGSVMPAFKGPQATLDNMTAYLMNQK